MKDPGNCPNCGVSFQGAPIPEKDRHLFGGFTHFSRLIGISENDRIARWLCPDCKHEFPR